MHERNIFQDCYNAAILTHDTAKICRIRMMAFLRMEDLLFAPDYYGCARMQIQGWVWVNAPPLAGVILLRRYWRGIRVEYPVEGLPGVRVRKDPEASLTYVSEKSSPVAGCFSGYGKPQAMECFTSTKHHSP